MDIIIPGFSITFAVVGTLLAIYMQIYTRLEKTRAESKELSLRTGVLAEKSTTETLTKLEAIANRLERLETAISLEPIAEERVQSIDNRLLDIEETLEPFKNRRLEVTSTEYQFLMFEIDRLARDLKEDLRRQHEGLIERQRTHEIDLNRRLGTFRTIFVVSLTVVGVIIAGFGVVIWFVGKG